MMSHDDQSEFTAADGFVVRLRGLPWSASNDEVAEFLSPATAAPNGIQFTFSREGRPSGEAFVELPSESDLETAVSKHKGMMGHRYIEVFRSKKSEMEWVIKRSGPNGQSTGEAVVRLRGLPFGCSKEEIAQFFSGMELVPNGITLPQDGMGRTTGDAYVQFATPDLAEQALLKHKQRIGHRYIEIFKSSLSEASGMGSGPMRNNRMMGGPPNRMGPYDRDRGRFNNMGPGPGGPGPMMGGGGRGGGGMGRGGNFPMGGDMGGMGGMGEILSNMILDRLRGKVGADNPAFTQALASNIAEEFEQGFGSGYGGGGGGRGGGGGYNGGGGGGGGPGGPGGRGNPGSHYQSTTGFSVHMRGIPFQASEADISEFFSPLRPAHVEVEYQAAGRPSGQANVDFTTREEAMQAMKKDRQNMQHRYIELFLNCKAAPRNEGNMGGGGRYGGGLAQETYQTPQTSLPAGGMSGGNMGGGMGAGMGGGMGAGMGGGMGAGMGGGMGGQMGGGGGMYDGDNSQQSFIGPRAPQMYGAQQQQQQQSAYATGMGSGMGANSYAQGGYDQSYASQNYTPF